MSIHADGHDPWPGDFDDELEDLPPGDVEVVESSTERRLVVQFTLDGEDADKLARIARVQGQAPSVVVRSLIRAAPDRAA